MSGLEIAGVVLGVIPLLIAAAEHLLSDKSTKEAVKIGNYARTYKTRLTQQQTLLSLYVKSIVGQTSLPASVQADLVEHIGGEVWERKDTTKAIADVLGDAHQPVIDLLKLVCATLASTCGANAQLQAPDDDVVNLLKRLSLEAQQSLDQSRGHVWRQFKLKCNAKVGRALVNQLDEYNTKLIQLSKAASQAKPYERMQETRRAHVAFGQREEAERLFHILRKVCKCQNASPDRDVALRLHMRDRPAGEVVESKFEMLLFDSQRAICEMSARITRAEGPEPVKKKARFADSSPENVSIHSLQRSNMKILSEICDEAKLAAAGKQELQLYVDSKEDVYSQLGEPTLSSKAPLADLLSLTSVMSRLQLYEKRKWLKREKCILAVTLAYSLLRLHESPWLQAHWNSNSISFLDEKSDKSTERFKLGRPFTRSQVATACCVQQPATAFKSTRQNAHIHALGIILVELYLNRSISADVDAQIQKYGPATYHDVAIRLMEDEIPQNADMSLEYERAIRFCLFPSPNPKSKSFSFEDQGFRELFYSAVISELENDMHARFEVADDELYI